MSLNSSDRRRHAWKDPVVQLATAKDERGAVKANELLPRMPGGMFIPRDLEGHVNVTGAVLSATAGTDSDS